MHRPGYAGVPRLWTLGTLVVMLLTLMLLTSACGGDSHAQQQASQNKTRLDNMLHHAQLIGVPASLLQPIMQKEQQLSSSGVPLSLFSDQPATDYYDNLATSYSQLQTMAQAAIASSTNNAQAQAQRDVQNFQATLAQRRAQGLPVQYYAQQFKQDQALLGAAQYPRDYMAISSNTHAATQNLDLMQDSAAHLATLNNTIAEMQTAHIDVTGMQTQYQNDQQSLASAARLLDFQSLNTIVDAQYQEAVVNSTQALPYVTAAKLDEFTTQMQQLKAYGMSTSTYQKQFDADRALMQKVTNLQDYLSFSKQVDAHIAVMHYDLVRGEANALVKQFHQEVDSWGNAHAFHDQYDGQNYALDNGYMQPGLGSDIDNDLAAASAPSDYQAVVDEANNALFNLHLMEADYKDHTPYDRVHATDMQMIDHYKLQKGQLLMISLVEQAMRVYQDGKLVKAFLVTTGREELPSVPGVWPVLDRQSPTVFKSSEPQSSPYWYPDTPIHYAILYHSGGYYVHDSWWRADYGPGTQFPHYDSGGDESFSGNGSHGCVNMQIDQAHWVFDNTDWNTQIVLY